jgi:hypothetical protein
MINNAILGVIAGQRIASTPGGDPHWANVVSLLRFDGSNGSGTFIDETGKTWTKTGAPTITTSTAVFDQSGVFTSTQALNSPVSADFNFGTLDFTIEGWFRTSNASTHYFVGNSIPSIDPPIWYIFRNSSGLLSSNFGGTTYSGTSIPLNTWHHIAFCRAAGVIRVYQNFVLTGSNINSTNFNSVSQARINLGVVTSGFQGLVGNIDEFRVTKGVGRYTGATIPAQAAPWPNF